MNEWIWMPHAGHLIVGRDCRFHLNTCVGGYIVSTVGEYWPDRDIRRRSAELRGITVEGRGDEWDANYLRLIGYEEIGYERLYETMVFRAVYDPENGCCPWRMESGDDLDFDGYNDAGDAFRGHMAMCAKWAREGVPA